MIIYPFEGSTDLDLHIPLSVKKKLKMTEFAKQKKQKQNKDLQKLTDKSVVF